MGCNAFVADEMLARPNPFDHFMFVIVAETELPFRNCLRWTRNAGVKTSEAPRRDDTQLQTSSYCMKRLSVVTLQQRDLYHADDIIVKPKTI